MTTLKIQLSFMSFLETPKGRILPTQQFGAQTEMVFSWVAKIYIDMRSALKQKLLGVDVWSAYRKWLNSYKTSGSVSDCPSFVYFLVAS